MGVDDIAKMYKKNSWPIVELYLIFCGPIVKLGYFLWPHKPKFAEYISIIKWFMHNPMYLIVS